MTRKLTILFALLALTGLALSACGGDDETTSAATTSSEETTETSAGAGGATEVLAVEADPTELAYTTTDLSTGAGTVEVEFENPASIGHDVRFEDPDGEDIGGTDVITGEATTAEVELQPGDYTYFCSVSGHREAGMEGQLEVK